LKIIALELLFLKSTIENSEESVYYQIESKTIKTSFSLVLTMTFIKFLSQMGILSLLTDHILLANKICFLSLEKFSCNFNYQIFTTFLKYKVLLISIFVLSKVTPKKVQRRNLNKKPIYLL
jgi:hypothetical protein